MVLNLFLWPTVCYMGHKLRIRAPPTVPYAQRGARSRSLGVGWAAAGSRPRHAGLESSRDPSAAAWGQAAGSPGSGRELSTRYRLAARTQKGEPRMEPSPRRNLGVLQHSGKSLVPLPPIPSLPRAPSRNLLTDPLSHPCPPEALTCPLLAGAPQQSA